MQPQYQQFDQENIKSQAAYQPPQIQTQVFSDQLVVNQMPQQIITGVHAQNFQPQQYQYQQIQQVQNFPPAQQQQYQQYQNQQPSQQQYYQQQLVNNNLAIENQNQDQFNQHESKAKFLCCMNIGNAATFMFPFDLLFTVVNIYMFIRLVSYPQPPYLLYPLLSLLCYNIPRVVFYFLSLKHGKKPDFLKKMYIMRLITFGLYTGFYTFITIMLFTISTARRPGDDGANINAIFKYLGLLFYSLPMLLFTILDGYYCVIMITRRPGDDNGLNFLDLLLIIVYTKENDRCLMLNQ
eukprot:403367182